MAKQQGTPGAFEQERITGRTIHYINEHPRGKNMAYNDQ